MDVPMFVDVFLAPVRDNVPVQAAMFGMLLLVLLDIVFGVSNSLIQKNFSSKRFREGLIHKLSEFGIVAVGIIVDGLFFAGLDLGFNGPILSFFLICLIVMEIGSIMELMAEINHELQDNKIFKLLASVKTPDLPMEEGIDD